MLEAVLHQTRDLKLAKPYLSHINPSHGCVVLRTVYMSTRSKWNSIRVVLHLGEIDQIKFLIKPKISIETIHPGVKYVLQSVCVKVANTKDKVSLESHVNNFLQQIFCVTKFKHVLAFLFHVYNCNTCFSNTPFLYSGTHIALILLAIHYVPEALFALTRIIHCTGKTDISQHGYVV